MRYQLRTQGRSSLQILPPNPSTFEGVKKVSEIYDVIYKLNMKFDEKQCECRIDT